MSVNINLLPEMRADERKRKSLVKKVNLTVFVILGLVLIISGGVFVINNITKKNLAAIQEDITKQEAVIDEEFETESLLLGLKDHIKSVAQILETRSTYSNFLINFAEFVPQSVVISDLTVSKDGSVTINGEAPSYEKVAGFVLILSGKNTEDDEAEVATDHIFSNVVLNSISKTETSGTVRFSISFTAQKGAFEE